MNDKMPEESRELEQDYAQLDWPVLSRDVVKDALAEARPIRLPVWRLATAAALALLMCGWWLTRSADVPDEAVLAWDGDQVLEQDLDRLQARIDRRPARPTLTLSNEDSFSSRTASLRRRVDRLKRTIEPEPPKAGSPVGTNGETNNEIEIA